METEVYGQLVTRNFLIQQIITCYEIFYIFLSGVIGTILNKMIATSILPASKLKDSLSTSTTTQQQHQSTGNNSTTSTIILSNNPETDHITPRINTSFPFINIIRNGYHHQKYFSSMYGKRIHAINRDVTDNKTDNFLTPSFCNIKRMTEIYCNESERLKTFQDWPLNFIDKEILAKTGFFFTGDDDKVKCFFCEVEIGRWESNDNPISEHTRWSPNCPLLRHRPTNNIPIDAESLNRLLPPISYDVCGANDMIEVRPNAYAEGSISSLSPIGSPINSLPNTPNSVTATTQTNFLYPDHPEYAIESARLRSFAEWPRTIKQKPEQLSEAGFFYTGIGDRVKCFSCGGGLKDWDENDDPWEQHALWLGNCHYLKLIKGTDYVQSVVEKSKTAEEEEEEAENEQQQEPKEIATNKNDEVRHIQNNGSSSSSSSSNNGNSNNSGFDEVPNLASTSSSSTSATLIVKAVALSTKSSEQSKNNNSNNHIHLNNSCSNCTSATSTTSSSDEENGSSSSSSSGSSSVSVSSVNSNSSKEAETVCKQPKLDCHHHHISRDLHHEKKSITISEEKLCKICYAAEYNTAFLPCGHVVACAKCASSVTKCPMCRKPFTDVMRVYFS